MTQLSDNSPIPEPVRVFRDRYRRDNIPAHYQGWLHLAFTFGLSVCVIAWSLSRLRAVGAVEWFTVPLTALYANLAEYWGHRGVMHHRRRGLELIHERHTRQHHRFFTAEAMQFEQLRDLRAVLFPPLLVTFFLAVFALPVGLALATLATPNVAWLFVATVLAYFLNYEFLHFAYHLPRTHPIARLPLLPRLERLHRAHHDPRLMANHNFNITYPVGDLLFRTLYRGE